MSGSSVLVRASQLDLYSSSIHADGTGFSGGSPGQGEDEEYDDISEENVVKNASEGQQEYEEWACERAIPAWPCAARVCPRPLWGVCIRIAYSFSTA
jgi:hypothetical protein